MLFFQNQGAKLHHLLCSPKFKALFFVTLTFRTWSGNSRDSEESPLTPLCIEDAERVEDPILFERPCKCIEDARCLVLRLDLPSASQRNFNQLTNSCLAVKVPLRGTFILLLCGPSGEDLRPSCMVFRTKSGLRPALHLRCTGG